MARAFPEILIVRTRRWRSILACLLLTACLFGSECLAAQLSQSQTVGEVAPDQPAGGQIDNRLLNCLPNQIVTGTIIGAAPTASTNCANEQPVSIGFRQNLGRDMDRMQAIARKNPYLRIGWPAEFEISRDLEDPREIILFDMFHPPAITSRVDEDMSYYSNSYDVPSIQEGFGPGHLVGKIDDPDFAQQFEAKLGQIIRTRAILLHATSEYRREYALCVEEGERACPESGISDTSNLFTNQSMHFGVRNQSQQAVYIYLLRIDADNKLELLLQPRDIGGTALAPGSLIEAKGKLIPLGPGRHLLVTIRSDEPVDPEIFTSDMPSGGDSSKCRTQLEQILCSIFSGTNITIPQLNEFIDASWSIGVDPIFVRTAMSPAVGGGDIAPANFAPWQVQIYSNQTYSKDQIQDDKKLGAKGKSLWRQQPFQRYHRCAGSLIAENIVLTAAHCVAKAPVDGLKVLSTREVLVGTQDLRRGGAAYRIVSVVKHPGYKPNSQKDDIAVVRIAPKSGTIPQKTILLPGDVTGFPKIGQGSSMQVLGWGYTNVVKRDERHEMTQDGPQFAQDRLRIADLQGFDVNACRKLKGYGDINKKICAVSPKSRSEPGNAFSCRGDSGGPVIRQYGGRIVQVGLVSGGVGCGADENGQQNPSLFVDIAQFDTWIHAATKRVRAISNTVEPLP
jgi:hypothetical protein